MLKHGLLAAAVILVGMIAVAKVVLVIGAAHQDIAVQQIQTSRIKMGTVPRSS